MEGKDESLVNTTDQLKEYRGARVLWPLQCSDQIMESAIDKATELLSEFDIDSEGLDISEKLKTFLDENYREHWQVICGRHFGCYAIHESNMFLYFYIDNIAFLAYKS